MAITARGLRCAGYAAGSPTTTRSLAGLLHGRGVSWIAAHCDRRGRPWFGPAELRSDGWALKLPHSATEGPRTHMADLGFMLDERESWAVEFERVGKSRPRLRRILGAYRSAELRGELDGVLYVCANESIVRLVQSVAEEVKLDRAVRTLDWVIAETRTRDAAEA